MISLAVCSCGAELAHVVPEDGMAEAIRDHLRLCDGRITRCTLSDAEYRAR